MTNLIKLIDKSFDKAELSELLNDQMTDPLISYGMGVLLETTVNIETYCNFLNLNPDIFIRCDKITVLDDLELSFSETYSLCLIAALDEEINIRFINANEQATVTNCAIIKASESKQINQCNFLAFIIDSQYTEISQVENLLFLS